MTHTKTTECTVCTNDNHSDHTRPNLLREDGIGSNGIRIDTFQPEELRPISVIPGIESLDFHLSPELEASEPPEARGLRRDEVRLMISYLGSGKILHTRFRSLSYYLDRGDVLVINTSGTLNASLAVCREDGAPLELHVSTHLPSGLFVVELRQPSPDGSLPFYSASSGETLTLPAGGLATLLSPHQPGGENHAPQHDRVRLWLASLHLPMPLLPYLERYGFPIRYKYVRDPWPNNYYQTVYVTEMGSAEMPSAGRAFTAELITQLVARGVQFAPLILHTGVASLEEHEPPYAEYYRVPQETAQMVNHARSNQKRLIAVGTTVVRALETVTDEKGHTHAGEGWTERIITPQSGIRSLNGLLTGLHEPRSTHLAMLEALAGVDHVRRTYTEAIAQGYLWHEFGDLHLILP